MINSIIQLGCRAGELLALQYKDIDFEAGTIYISKTLIETENPAYDKNNPELMKEQGIKRTLFAVQKNTKTDRNRYVPMNNKAKELLLAHRAVSKYTDSDDFVISTRNRKTTTIQSLLFQKILVMTVSLLFGNSEILLSNALKV